jgi:hypothetical protein
MNKRISLLLSVCFFVTGCASIVSKSQYPVTIASNPDQAIITITDDHGKQIFKGKTPTTLTLKAGEAYFHGCSYTINYEKEGYEPQTATLQKRLDGWYIGNILFGGLIGMLIVDPLTGAMWRLDSDVTVNLAEKTAKSEGGSDIQVVIVDDVPKYLRSKMIRIN